MTKVICYLDLVYLYTLPILIVFFGKTLNTDLLAGGYIFKNYLYGDKTLYGKGVRAKLQLYYSLKFALSLAALKNKGPQSCG